MRFRIVLILSLGFGLFSTGYGQVRFQGFGARLGIVKSENFDATVTPEVFADFGKLNDKVMLQARLGYWSQTSNGGALRDIIIGGSALYEIETTMAFLTPYVGGGLSLHIQRSEVDLSDLLGEEVPRQISSDSDIGFDLKGGAFLNLGEPFALNGEIVLTITEHSQIAAKAGFLIRMNR